MSRATITIEDDGEGGFISQIEYDPPPTAGEKAGTLMMSAAQARAAKAYDDLIQGSIDDGAEIEPVSDFDVIPRGLEGHPETYGDAR